MFLDQRFVYEQKALVCYWRSFCSLLRLFTARRLPLDARRSSLAARRSPLAAAAAVSCGSSSNGVRCSLAQRERQRREKFRRPSIGGDGGYVENKRPNDHAVDEANHAQNRASVREAENIRSPLPKS